MDWFEDWNAATKRGHLAAAALWYGVHVLDAFGFVSEWVIASWTLNAFNSGLVFHPVVRDAAFVRHVAACVMVGVLFVQIVEVETVELGVDSQFYEFHGREGIIIL